MVVLLIEAVIAALFMVSIIITQQRCFAKTRRQVKSPVRRGRLSDIHGGKKGEVTKESDFPDGWWTSNELLVTEQRSIFAKMPVALAHASMFPKPGSYITVKHPSGYPLFLILGKDRILRGFHNVCRHRAYPIVSSKQSGCTSVLGCKYHGWSYNFKGHLVKAPKFDGQEGFDKSTNSLFGVNVRVDDKGVVFVDTSSKPDAGAYVEAQRFSGCIVDTWEVEGKFNWKLAESVDAFVLPTLTTESYHEWSFTRLIVSLGIIQGTLHEKPSVLTDIIATPELKSSLTITIYPVTADKCIIKCILYTTSSIPAVQTVLSSMKDEISYCISSLETIYSRLQTSDTIFDIEHHTVIMEWLRSHRSRETLTGRRVWPALEPYREAGSESNAAENLCQELDKMSESCESVSYDGSMEALTW